ncbi:hypothetical protein HELRODRAFT_184369 [Helobdella robusta]|uniref:Uncharacterized protein n=1 Tax=Helobdella robusta TaxID=6412 RepID=T1FL26_HELRO|nr:hypothetical protein HELRODRAFT_184369 [Helobdella robusta]ESO00130.1 hypothetical protein HELRODRAFT_184369 [Helobdella robusta]
MHQRSCKTYKSLKANISNVETDDDSDGRQAAFKHTSTTAAISKPLLGIKMPKSSIHWSEANAFFQMELKPLDIISDIDSFAIKRRVSRNDISYFAANCAGFLLSPLHHTPVIWILQLTMKLRKSSEKVKLKYHRVH